MRRWLAVYRAEPCPICGKPDWCSRSADSRFHLCRRQGGPGAIERKDKNGTLFWLYPQGNASPRQDISPLPLVHQPERADAVDLNRIYQSLLTSLRLEARHRQDLRHRGLDDAAIQHGG